MVSVGPSLTVLLEGFLVFRQFILRNVESLLSLVNGVVRQLTSGLISLVLPKSGLEVNEVLGSVTKVLLQPNNYLNTYETYLFKRSLISNGGACGDILGVAGVGEVGVASLVSEVVILVGESVLEPVAVKHFRLVGVLMHSFIKINYILNLFKLH